MDHPLMKSGRPSPPLPSSPLSTPAPDGGLLGLGPNPAATTVTSTASPKVSSTRCPKIISALSSALSVMTLAA